MVERRLELINQLGLHARAGAKLVHCASRYSCEVRVGLDDSEVDAKSILGLLLLAAPFGSEITVRCSGPDEDEALEAIADLVASRFGEDS
jgi:phosphocarrier protein